MNSHWFCHALIRDAGEGAELPVRDAGEGAADDPARNDLAVDDLAATDDPAAPEAAAEAATEASAKPAKRKSADEISHDIMHHSVSMLRGFFVAVAKSIHAPARRREDPANFADPAKPGLGARSSAMLLAALLKGSLDVELPPSATCAPQDDTADKDEMSPEAAAAAGAASAVDAMALDAATPPPPTEAQDPAASVPSLLETGKKQGKLPSNNHFGRLAEEVSTVLFDSRRRSCHVLIFNYFVALGGLDSLLVRFSQVGREQGAYDAGGSVTVTSEHAIF